MIDVLEIIVREARKPEGKPGSRGLTWHAFAGGRRLGTFRDPLVGGARKLIRLGYTPGRLVTLRHEGAGHVAFVPLPLGRAAGSPDGRPYRPMTPTARAQLDARRRAPDGIALDAREKPRVGAASGRTGASEPPGTAPANRPSWPLTRIPP